MLWTHRTLLEEGQCKGWGHFLSLSDIDFSEAVGFSNTNYVVNWNKTSFEPFDGAFPPFRI